MPPRDDRGYKVVYTTRVRDPSPTATSVSRQSSRTDDYNSSYRRNITPRSYRYDDRIDDDRYTNSSAKSSSRTKQYDIVRGSQRDDLYIKPRNNGTKTDNFNSTPPRRRDDPSPDYNVIRSERPESKSSYYLIEPQSSKIRRQKDDDTDYRPRYQGPRDYQSSIRDTDSISNTHTSTNGIQVELESSDEDEEDNSYRGRKTKTQSSRHPRLRSAIRGANDRSPDSLRRRRSRSVGFRRDQIDHHDVDENRHERPGAEAVLVGRYLKGNMRNDDESDLYSDRGSISFKSVDYGRDVRSTGRRKGDYDDNDDEIYSNGYNGRSQYLMSGARQDKMY